MKFSGEFILLASGPIFLTAILWEQFKYKKSHPERFDTKDTINNMALALLQQGAEFLAVAINWFFIKDLFDFLFTNGLRLSFLQNQNWLYWASLFIIQDFLYYWFHRVSHRSRWFWSAHVTHHSSKYMNFSTASSLKMKSVFMESQKK